MSKWAGWEDLPAELKNQIYELHLDDELANYTSHRKWKSPASLKDHRRRIKYDDFFQHEVFKSFSKLLILNREIHEQYYDLLRHHIIHNATELHVPVHDFDFSLYIAMLASLDSSELARFQPNASCGVTFSLSMTYLLPLKKTGLADWLNFAQQNNVRPERWSADSSGIDLWLRDWFGHEFSLPQAAKKYGFFFGRDQSVSGVVKEPAVKKIRAIDPVEFSRVHDEMVEWYCDSENWTDQYVKESDSTLKQLLRYDSDLYRIRSGVEYYRDDSSDYEEEPVADSDVKDDPDVYMSDDNDHSEEDHDEDDQEPVDLEVRPFWSPNEAKMPGYDAGFSLVDEAAIEYIGVENDPYDSDEELESDFETVQKNLKEDSDYYETSSVEDDTDTSIPSGTDSESDSDSKNDDDSLLGRSDPTTSLQQGHDESPDSNAASQSDSESEEETDRDYELPDASCDDINNTSILNPEAEEKQADEGKHKKTKRTGLAAELFGTDSEDSEDEPPPPKRARKVRDD